MGNSSNWRICNYKLCCRADPPGPFELKFLEGEFNRAFALNQQASQGAMGNSPQISNGTSNKSTSAKNPERFIKKLNSDPYRKSKLIDAMNSASTLTLKVISSSTLTKNMIINITPLGYQDSPRAEKDGITYFGCKRRMRLPTGKGPIINDFIIPLLDNTQANQHRGAHFIIYYDPDLHVYIVKDLAIGYGTFVKLEEQLMLRDNHLLHIGQSYIVVNLLPSDNEYPRLRLKIFGGPGAGQVSYFDNQDYIDRYIRIGRLPNCEVNIQDSLLSKIQCSITWNNSEGWVLHDGDVKTHRTSTNSTWLYLSESHEIRNGMVFKSNHTLFQVSLGERDQYTSKMEFGALHESTNLRGPSSNDKRATVIGRVFQKAIRPIQKCGLRFSEATTEVSSKENESPSFTRPIPKHNGVQCIEQQFQNLLTPRSLRQRKRPKDSFILSIGSKRRMETKRIIEKFELQLQDDQNAQLMEHFRCYLDDQVTNEAVVKELIVNEFDDDCQSDEEQVELGANYLEGDLIAALQECQCKYNCKVYLIAVLYKSRISIQIQR